jgi:DNA-binding NarL/FixJ family response regulator
MKATHMQHVNILVVDDSELVGERLRKLLSALPSIGAVHYLRTLEAASEHLEVVRPDVLILDHHFPEGPGEKLLARHARTLADVHVIVYSAYGLFLDHARYRALGADVIFDKSAAPDDLMLLVESVLRIRSQRQYAPARATVGMAREGERAA